MLNVRASNCPQGKEREGADHGETFVPGSIHHMDFRDFWVKTLQCAPWVENVLKFGYRLPFTSAPGVYYERNNASVRQNMNIVLDLVDSLHQHGVIDFVDVRPTCVNPLGLVSKTIDGCVTHRLVLDVSRWVNKFTSPSAVKLSHLEKALEITQQGDFQTIFDLKSAYHHVKIAPEHFQYLGAAVERDGKICFFVFKHLPFGLNSAVHAITKLWKPLSAFLHKQGIRFSIYIDDGRILTRSASEAETARNFVYEVIQRAGWQLAWKKSDSENDSSTVKKYLGFWVDSNAMSVTYPLEKWDDLCACLNYLLQRQSVPVKELSKVLGRIVALRLSHGRLVHICTRSSYNILQDHVDFHGWQGTLQWSEAAVRELRFFLINGQSFNGQLIAQHLQDVVIHTDTIVSDASAFRAAVKWLEGPNQDTVTQFAFTEQEQTVSSGERELLALHKWLQLPGLAGTIRNAQLMWLTDSTNFVAFVMKGSSKPTIQNKVFDILSTLTSWGCAITPIHVRREDERIQQVDHLSKVLDTDNWSIDSASFKSLHDAFHFEIDLFADNKNRKVDLFASKYFHELSVAVDAFSIPWKGMLWVCPPTFLLHKVVKRIRSSPCKGVLIVPNWPASSFYCLFFYKNAVLPPFELISEFRPYVIQNEGARNTPLYGFTDFTFFAFYFCTL